MIDREKVVKGLECCRERNKWNSCLDCPYENPWGNRIQCAGELSEDVLALLKEKENEIDNLNTLLMGYQTGALKPNLKNCE